MIMHIAVVGILLQVDEEKKLATVRLESGKIILCHLNSKVSDKIEKNIHHKASFIGTVRISDSNDTIFVVEEIYSLQE